MVSGWWSNARFDQVLSSSAFFCEMRFPILILSISAVAAFAPSHAGNREFSIDCRKPNVGNTMAMCSKISGSRREFMHRLAAAVIFTPSLTVAQEPAAPAAAPLTPRAAAPLTPPAAAPLTPSSTLPVNKPPLVDPVFSGKHRGGGHLINGGPLEDPVFCCLPNCCFSAGRDLSKGLLHLAAPPGGRVSGVRWAYVSEGIR